LSISITQKFEMLQMTKASDRQQQYLYKKKNETQSLEHMVFDCITLISLDIHLLNIKNITLHTGIDSILDKINGGYTAG
jgi:hypothetical protein